MTFKWHLCAGLELWNHKTFELEETLEKIQCNSCILKIRKVGSQKPRCLVQGHTGCQETEGEITREMAFLPFYLQLKKHLKR